MSLKKSISLFLALCMVISVFTVAPFGVSAAKTEVADTGASVELADTGAGMYGLVDNVQNGQILQCWNWSYQNIAANMSLIAQQGFSAIQTSPIQATKETTREYYNTVMNSSWVVYQPLTFTIETNSYNALGTKDDFKYMCEVAHKYGVKVIVDVIFNHMANDMSGNTIHPYIPSDLKDNPDCWHDITQNIYNFDNRYDVTHYCLTGLPDLNTANSTVQFHCTNLLKEAIDAGADGFRIDAAKHIETDWDADGTKSDFWGNVLGAANAYAQETRGFTPYYYGEVLGSPGGGLSIEAYTRYMSVTDPGSSDTIRNAVCGGDAASAVTGNISCGAAKNKTVQWTESHDNHKDSGTNNISENNINKTWALVGSKNEVCGMYLARPENMNTTLMGEADLTSWTYPEVKAVNNFKNRFAGQSEYLSSYYNLACIERGTSGMIIVNTGGTFYNGMSAPVHTMAAGTYKDAITGNTFTVSNGYITGDIGDTGIAVIYDVDNSGTFSKGNVTEVSVAGDFNGWDANADRMIAVDGNTVTTSMYLEKGTYGFKLSTTNGIWMGNSGVVEDTTTATSDVGWQMTSADQNNCTLEASGGKYTFTFNVSTGMLVIDYEDTTDTTSDFYLKGTFNDWGTTHPLEYTSGDNVVSTTMVLEAGTYTFKINNPELEVWYGNSGTITDTTGADAWLMDTAAGDCTIAASGGTYKFNFNLSTQKLTVTTDAVAEPTEPPSTEVTEPTVTDPAGASDEFCIRGDFNGWGTEDKLVKSSESDVATIVLELSKGSYGFKVYNITTDGWLGNGGTIEDTTIKTSEIGWEMSANDGDCTLEATGGTYTFNFNTSTNFLEILYTPAETDATEATYTVTFKDYNGMILSEQKVKEGETVIPPADPTRAADAQYTYTFKGWDTDFTNITEDTVVTAVYDSKVNVYTVAFMDYDGTVLLTQQVEYGSAATAPENPTREDYVFTGWDTAFDSITKDTTVTATYRERGNVYTVAFVDYDGTVLSTQDVEAGQSATAPEVPQREGYAFIGWDKAFDNISDNITITATYAELTVFLMGSFNEWQQKDAMLATDDANLVSVELELEAGTYTFKIMQNGEWFGNGGIIEDTTEATSSIGWAMETGQGDCTLVATGGIYTFNFNIATGMLVLIHTVPEYTVTFVDWDGKVLSTQQIKRGEAAKTPANPTREGNAQYSYTFTGWDGDYSSVKADTTVTATYLQTVNKYTVTFKDFDGTVLRTQQVEYGSAAVAPASPTRNGYTFTGWDDSYKNIKGDVTVTALYRKNAEPIVSTTGSLNIDVIGGTGFKIVVNGSAARPQGVSYINSQMPINVSVTVTANKSSSNEFMGWVNAANGQILTTDYTYTFTTTGRDYLRAMFVTDYSDMNTVIFKNDKAFSGNGQILDQQHYVAGDEIVFPDEPSQVGFEFAGWSMTNEDIQAELAAGNDVTVLAVWKVQYTYVEVEIIGGTGTGYTNGLDNMYLAKYKLTLTADEAPEGKKFAYWKIGEVIKSYSETFVIYPVEATTAEAVFIDKNESIDYQVIVNVDAIDTTSISNKNVFYYSWYVPEEEMGITFVKSGILAVNKNAYTGNNLVVGTSDANVFDRSPSTLTPIGAMSWTKPEVAVGETWVARAYVQYVNASGETMIVYSNLMEATKE